jgi:maltose alpha-D-glucosyltransferase/alpha-amylase
LAKGREPSFGPEPFTSRDQQSLYQEVRDLDSRVFDLLRGRLADLPEAVREEARQVLERARSIPDRLGRIQEGPLTGQRIRCHGDYHLGQVLFTGQDFVIIDFEGEPARPLAERRRKSSPLRDVAGMIRSFHWWYSWASAAFLGAYQTAAACGSFLPASRQELELLLDTYLLEKAMYELAYELNHRPDWVRIPLRGIGQLLE